MTYAIGNSIYHLFLLYLAVHILPCSMLFDVILFFHVQFFYDFNRWYLTCLQDYGIDFDDTDQPVELFQCRCGSKFCRNMKRSNSKLILNLYEARVEQCLEF